MIKSADEIKTALGGLDGEIDVIVKETTVSTNSDGKEIIRRGITRPTLIVAGEQTGGRGRQGKSFVSPPGGLYMTLVLPTDIPLSDAVSSTSCTAVAVCRSLDSFGIYCGIKWVNDVYSGEKKLCGILVEAENDYTEMKTKALIVGIGINFSVSPTVSGSVRTTSLAEIGCTADMAELCASIVRELMALHRIGFSFSAVREEYIRRSLVLGRRITYIEKGVTKVGYADSIGEKGELTVITGGEKTVLSSGEISLRL